MGSPLDRLMNYTAQAGRFAGLDRVVAPTNSVLLTTVKAHLRVDYNDEDTLLQLYIDAAVDYVERLTGANLLTQQWRLTLDSFPNTNYIQLLHHPVASVGTFATYNEAGTEDTTFASYTLDTAGGRVLLNDGATWPTDLRDYAAVAITYTTGWGATLASIPAPYVQAVLMLCGHWNENREAVGTVTTQVALGVAQLINANRRPRL